MYLLINIGLIIICYTYMKVETRIKKNQRKFVFFILIVCISIAFAFRPESTKDTRGYINGFEHVGNLLTNNISFFQKYQGYEIGYIFLMKLFKHVSNNYRFFFFTISFIGLSTTIYALNYLTYKTHSDISYDTNNKVFVGSCLALHISYFGFLYNGISVRAGLSMGIGLMAMVYMKREKYIKGLLLFFIALSIQRTAFLFIIFYLILKFMPPLGKKIHYILWFVSGVVMFSGIGNRAFYFIATKLLALFDRFMISGYAAYLLSPDLAIGIRDIYLWLMYVFLILISSNKEHIQKYLNIVMLGNILIVFMYGARAISRAYDLFFLFSIPIVANYYYGMSEDNYNVLYRLRKLCVAALICMNSILMLRLCFY